MQLCVMATTWRLPLDGLCKPGAIANKAGVRGMP